MSKVSIIAANKSNKQALQDWDEFLTAIRNSTPVDLNETDKDKAKRIKKLNGDFEEWVKYYFPKYCFAPSAQFQRKSSQRIFKAENMFYQRRAWARGLSKSTRRMMEILYLKFVKKLRINALLISKSYDNAERLLGTYMGNLEANQRLINDYGVQERPGKWKSGEFTTKDNCTFRAVGADQNPRGAKNEELRINVLIFDDVDDDEVCRNADRLHQRWLWIEQAVIPTVDIAKMYYIFFDNNIIAEDSLAVKAGEYATDVELVNVRDADGNSTWPEKNSNEDIGRIEGSMSYESFEKEYMNNPIESGKTFEEMQFAKCPPLHELEYAVVYADPSPSNKDKPSIKSKAQNSCKAVAVLGCANNKFYLYKCWVQVTTNSNFIDWLYAAKHYVGNATQLYTFIENNTLQNPFYEQVLLPLIFEKEEENGGALMVTPDDTMKPDKWFRIEGTLEPLNRLGRLLFNIEEKENEHMKRMVAQFKSAKPSSKVLDGPDAVQGGVKIIQNKNAVSSAGGITIIPRRPNNKRY